jgi:hypothetical protein
MPVEATRFIQISLKRMTVYAKLNRPVTVSARLHFCLVFARSYLLKFMSLVLVSTDNTRGSLTSPCSVTAPNSCWMSESKSRIFLSLCLP